MLEFTQMFAEAVARIWYLIRTQILSDPVGDLVLVVIILSVALIIIKRNHLDKRRALSNIAQVLAGLVGWLIITFYYSRGRAPTDSELIVVSVTIILCLGFCAGVVIAAFVKRYAAAPMAKFRADIACFFMKLAELVADDKHYATQKSRVQTIINSITLIDAVVHEHSQTEASTEGIG